MAKLKSLISGQKNLTIFSPSIDHGGVEKNLFLLTEFLSKNLSNVSVITSNFSDKKYFSKKINILTPSKNFFKIKNRFLKNLVCAFILIKLIVTGKKFILLSFNSNLYATIIAKLFLIKVIIRINASYRLWGKNFLKKMIFNLFLKFPDEVIVNSLDLKKEIDHEFNISSSCILNPLNKKKIFKLRKSKKNLFNVNNRVMKILFIGRLVEQKDPFTFLKAIKYIPEKIKFKSIMLGSGYLKNDILKYIESNNLKHKLLQLDYSTKAIQYLNQCDLLVLSSKYEGLPNVLLEAQLLKKFIISTNCPTGPREILLGGRAGSLVQVNQPKALTKKIIEFSKNRKKQNFKKKIKIGFRELYRYDFDKNCQKYLDLIKKYI